ncbi:MAG: hypothetical protein IPI46_04965 [Bacteroidetes bacterium]|nr:hypothetical protein [Bacteroidota bacterium]
MKLKLLLCFLLMGLQASSQKITLTEKEAWNSRLDSYAILGKYQQYTAVYYNHTSIGEVFFYGKNFMKEKLTTLGFLPNKTENVFFNTTANHMSVCYVVKENKMKKVYAAKLLPDFSWSEPIVIDSVISGSYRYQSNYTFVSSQHDTKILCYTSLIENEQTTMQAVVMDAELNIENRFRKTFAQTDLFISSHAVISQSGNAYILATDVQNQQEVFGKLTLVSCVNHQPEVKEILLDSKNYMFSDIHMKFDEKQHNLIVCSYFLPDKMSQPRGIFYTLIDEATQSVNGSFFTPLTLQVTNRQAGLRDLKIRDIYFTDKHEIEIVAEKMYQTVRTIQRVAPISSTSFTFNNQQEIARTVEEFSFDEIIIFHCKADGSLAWSQSVLKEQTTTDDGGIFSSFAVVEHALGKGLLFSDVSSSQNRFLGAYVSYKGDVTMKELALPAEADDWNLIPRHGKQISKSEMIVPCVSKSYICFLKITY